MLLDFVLEGIFLRTGMYAYAGVVQDWALCYASLYAYRDDTGRTLVERGADRLNVSRRIKTLSRFLALVAVFNLIFLTQNLFMATVNLHADAFPDGYKSYQLNGLCGPGTSYDCTAPEVPVPKQTTPTNRVVGVGR